VKAYLNIHDIVVYERFRSKGLGKALMEKLVEISVERDYCKITLEVREDNQVAQSLYRSLGFEECKPNMFFWTKKLN
jgi:ribosomal protein S18 acetylase RimI-like enzyme